ncbi:MAG: protein YgfX [Pseudomonadota bacterium]
MRPLIVPMKTSVLETNLMAALYVATFFTLWFLELSIVFLCAAYILLLTDIVRYVHQDYTKRLSKDRIFWQSGNWMLIENNDMIPINLTGYQTWGGWAITLKFRVEKLPCSARKLTIFYDALSRKAWSGLVLRAKWHEHLTR